MCNTSLIDNPIIGTIYYREQPIIETPYKNPIEDTPYNRHPFYKHPYKIQPLSLTTGKMNISINEYPL